jgi:DNA-binding transcriptional ArsR family regulator
MTARDLQRMKELFTDGRTTGEIAAELGYSARTVRRHLHELGLLRRRVVDERERRQIGRLYAGGLGIAEIARLLDRAHKTIREQLDLLGIPCRPSSSKPPPRTCELASCRKNFTPTADKLRRGAGRFCSYAHWNQWRTGRPQRKWRRAR